MTTPHCDTPPPRPADAGRESGARPYGRRAAPAAGRERGPAPRARTTAAGGPLAGAQPSDAVRLTWAQPEDLIGHELRQAAEDGRDAGPTLRAWLAAGGRPAPERAGASDAPAPPHLRALASRLLDELAALPSPVAPHEPTAWAAIVATWPTPPGPGPRNPTEPATDPDPRNPTEPATDPDPRNPTEPGAGPGPLGPTEPGAGPGPRNPTDPAAGPGPLGRTEPATDPDPGGPTEPAAGPGPRNPTDPAAGPGPLGPTEPATDPGPGGRTEPGTEPGPGAGTPEPAAPGRTAGSRSPGPGGTPATHPRRPEPAAAHRPAAGRDSHPGPRRGGVAEPAPPVDERLRERLEAAWLGRAVGCLLGKPVEKLPLDGIRALARAAGNWPLDDWFTARGVPPRLLAAHPWNRRSAPTSLAENIDGMPEDDDLNYPLLGLLLLRRHGKGFTTADVARLWLDELPAGRTFTAERVAYRNLLHGLEPPATATHHNPFREWIGALIRADVHGWTRPGDPVAAAAQAHRDATLTHTGNGVYAALFVAAATAEAAGGRADVHTALRAGLAVVPPGSRLAEAVRFAIRTAAAETDFDLVVDRLHARYGHYHWVHAVPNTALIAAALTHADGDFTRSVCRAVSGGWDTDSNGATAGALAGLLAGSPGRIPARWTAPLGNRLSTTVAGFDGTGFDTLAQLTAQEAARS
ncbi:ADP-ribosylglycohydrolase family protein [Streptomyces sp. NPDC091027]|uniref:ADP-ribosylglycohydrolase family protein n=1 Tax=Streptomyces sp. NPDC091027 TaxID=3365971 RepID=UPI003807CAC4